MFSAFIQTMTIGTCAKGVELVVRQSLSSDTHTILMPMLTIRAKTIIALNTTCQSALIRSADHRLTRKQTHHRCNQYPTRCGSLDVHAVGITRSTAPRKKAEPMSASYLQVSKNAIQAISHDRNDDSREEMNPCKIEYPVTAAVMFAKALAAKSVVER